VITNARDATHSLEWSSSMFSISNTSPVAIVKWVISDCHISFGRSAQKVRYELFGLFWGCGVTKPRAFNTRQIEETDGTASEWRFWRW
jgi:hypothetical protein